MAVPGEHHPAFEEYCETIFELREDDLDVIQARIADRLRVSRPSVSEMIKRMSDESLIEVAGGKITLTVTGEELAVRVVRRHRIGGRRCVAAHRCAASAVHALGRFAIHHVRRREAHLRGAARHA